MTDLMVQTVRTLHSVSLPGTLLSMQAFLTYDCALNCTQSD